MGLPACDAMPPVRPLCRDAAAALAAVNNAERRRVLGLRTSASLPVVQDCVLNETGGQAVIIR